MAQDGQAVRIVGSRADEAAELLAQQLRDRGYSVEQLEEERVGPGAGFLCRMLSESGSMVVATGGDAPLDCDCIAFDADSAPSAAALVQTILEKLQDRGLISRAQDVKLQDLQ
jgi:hypothetical protein